MGGGQGFQGSTGCVRGNRIFSLTHSSTRSTANALAPHWDIFLLPHARLKQPTIKHRFREMGFRMDPGNLYTRTRYSVPRKAQRKLRIMQTQDYTDVCYPIVQQWEAQSHCLKKWLANRMMNQRWEITCSCEDQRPEPVVQAERCEWEGERERKTKHL